MGRATRWFKGLFGIKAAKENVGDGYPSDRRTNARQAASGMCNNPATILPNITPAEAAWLRSFFNETDKEHSKHAIAVAAATAAAADAAVAAAQAAVAVVRLTRQQGRGGGGGNSHTANTGSFGGREKYLAALKVQTVFRRFLARKALRALKGLVKIQALVRGFLVRKQAAATLHSMQALIRAQASVRAQRNQSFINVNISTKNPARNTSANHVDTRSQEFSRRLSASLEPTASTPPFDQESPKIVEVDTGSKARISKSRRTNSWMTNPESVDIESLAIPHRFNHTNPSSRLLIPDERDNNYWDEERCHISTAQSTPRIASCGCEHELITPSKSICLDGSYNEDDKLLHPSYMAKTVSSKAKLRSRSAPRQRLDGGFSKRRISLHEIMESRNSLRMERSCSQDQRAVTFKNAVMGKIGKSSDYFFRNQMF